MRQEPLPAIVLPVERGLLPGADGTIDGTGEFSLEVVGEQSYQDAIAYVAGGRKRDSCERVVRAILVLENDNPHDNKAVQVRIEGYVCGYLSRSHARQYRARLKKEGYKYVTLQCHAMIVGGWHRSESDWGYFGVRLDIPTNDT